MKSGIGVMIAEREGDETKKVAARLICQAVSPAQWFNDAQRTAGPSAVNRLGGYDANQDKHLTGA